MNAPLARPEGELSPLSGRVSIVTPLYRSAPYIRELHARLVEAVRAAGYPDYEIIFVHDASPDDSLAVALEVAAADPRVTVIDLARNFGQHKAILTGLRHATGDHLFILDSDLEEDPEWLGLFTEEMRRRRCDVVFGVSRNIKRGYAYSFGRQVFFGAVNVLSGIDFPRNLSAARLMTRRYVEALLSFKETEIFLDGMCWMAGFSQVPVEVVKHDTSPSTYSIRRLWALFLDGITSFSTRPLQFIAFAGFGLSVIAFAYVTDILFQKVVYGIDVEGWASVMGVLLIVSGISLFFQGVVAVYVSKIFLEVKQRPMTIVREIHRSALAPQHAAPPKSADRNLN